jgi:hypothetical protein
MAVRIYKIKHTLGPILGSDPNAKFHVRIFLDVTEEVPPHVEP